ncbi:hypothetical protein SAMN04487905_110102 [Actinopolyspora xinjiangensis]|uniref:Uncharacterized protein n=1 Tax=Actinopolyspora xinjiangensis TaxID=405564 RepID=A0A1H0W0N9_9ACTN|nr:hypothetical protein [Actinopolyspora xinjiangensis]SDP84300.1 hypothetical protein SAMN04487905_110102 [Actinopolyspora xinjiangensis]
MYCFRFGGAAVSTMGIAAGGGNIGVFYSILSFLSLVALLLCARSLRQHTRLPSGEPDRK